MFTKCTLCNNALHKCTQPWHRGGKAVATTGTTWAPEATLFQILGNLDWNAPDDGAFH